MKKLLCRIGIHWLVNHTHNFIDKVSGKTVYNTECDICGKKYMSDSPSPLLGFRVLRPDNSYYKAAPKLPSLKEVQYSTCIEESMVEDIYNLIKQLGNFA